MSDWEQIEQAILSIEAQRLILGDKIVEAALAPLREKLALLLPKDSPEFRSESLPVGQRRPVTILFCDVKGSTSMAEKLDPEDWANIMDRAYKYLIKPIHKYDGMVVRLLGDGMLAVFGAQVAKENDPQRAVLAGLEIIEGVESFQKQVEKEIGLNFTVRVGINTGLVVLMETGADETMEFTAMGDPVNLAARIEQTALPGTVQISANTYKFVESLFEFKPLGAIKVKGKNEPVITYQVIGSKLKSNLVKGWEHNKFKSSLVGRETELNMLRQCIDQLLDGQGGIVGILGEAGIGKSRLLSEVQGYLEKEQVYWLEGQALTYGRTISYWPFQEIIRQFVNITDEDDETEVWHKLEQRINDLFPDIQAEILPYIASLISVSIREDYADRVRYLDGEAMGKQVFLASRRFFNRISHTRPLILVFEDLHWIDESSVKLLKHLFPLVENVPLLIIGLSRPDPNTPAAHLRQLCERDYAHRYNEINLTSLSISDSEQLIQNLLEADDSSLSALGYILIKAEGNPLFLEELVCTLIDTEAINRTSSTGQWQITKQIDLASIPDTLQGLILARLDLLDEEIKQVLRVASVIGRSFLYCVLQSIVDVSEELLSMYLSELEQYDFILKKQSSPEQEYIFKHALVQEAIYENILIQHRRELHRRVALRIETLFSDRLEEFYGLLAYHYAKAEAWEEAHTYLMKGGDQAGRIAADAEALVYYQQAINTYSHSLGKNWDPIQRSALERKIGQALMRRGEPLQALKHIEVALELLSHPIPVTRNEVRRAVMKEVIQQLGHRIFPGLFLHKASVTPISQLEEEFDCYETICWVEALRNNVERYSLAAIRLLNRSEQTGVDYRISQAAGFVGQILDFLPVHWLAKRYLNLAISIAEKTQHPSTLGYVYEFLALHEQAIGQLTSSFEHSNYSSLVNHRMGNLRNWGLCNWSSTLSMTYLGNFNWSFQASQNMIRLGQEGADQEVLCWGLGTLGEVLRRMGNIESAIKNLEEARKLAEAIPDYLIHGLIMGELGRAYLSLGDTQKALTILEEGERIRSKNDVRGPTVSRLINGLAEIYLFLAEVSPTEGWLNKAAPACKKALKQGQSWRYAFPDALLLQGRYEWIKGNHGKAKKLWEKSLALAEEMGEVYDAGKVYLEMGKRMKKQEHLERAKMIFIEIGAVWDLEKTMQLLV
jgi:class 3 adenylate cyclase/tetratricopeptide (TPR) repeat protein